MIPNDLLDMKLRDVSNLLCEQLIDNKKNGIDVAGATLEGTNTIDGKRVQLCITLTKKPTGDWNQWV